MFGRLGVNEEGLRARLNAINARYATATPEQQEALVALPPIEVAPLDLPPLPAPVPPPAAVLSPIVAEVAPRIYPLVMQKIDTGVAAKLGRDEL
ncbi:MAG TPA: hypothetical protein VFA22_11385, partial [Stellaceae bacterium]|nr:hypothetical protein [Stellaceae bacterium]